jgi:hypothetical protein
MVSDDPLMDSEEAGVLSARKGRGKAVSQELRREQEQEVLANARKEFKAAKQQAERQERAHRLAKLQKRPVADAWTDLVNGADEEMLALLQRYGSRLKLTGLREPGARRCLEPLVPAEPSAMTEVNAAPRVLEPTVRRPDKGDKSITNISGYGRGSARSSTSGAADADVEGELPRRTSCHQSPTRASVVPASRTINFPSPSAASTSAPPTLATPRFADSNAPSPRVQAVDAGNMQTGQLLRRNAGASSDEVGVVLQSLCLRKDRLRRKQEEILRKVNVGHYRQHLKESFEKILEEVESCFGDGKTRQPRGVPMPTVGSRNGHRAKNIELTQNKGLPSIEYKGNISAEI